MTAYDVRVVAGRLYVILSETKDPLAGYTLSTVIPREHSDRGNLSQCVILSETKDPLAGYTLSTVIPREHSDRGNLALATRYQRGLSLVGFEEILHSVQNDRA